MYIFDSFDYQSLLSMGNIKIVRVFFSYGDTVGLYYNDRNSHGNIRKTLALAKEIFTRLDSTS